MSLQISRSCFFSALIGRLSKTVPVFPAQKTKTVLLGVQGTWQTWPRSHARHDEAVECL